ncbi:MAG: AmmeMemoRadiSam system protein B, partial [Candidatus Hydrogenedentes bacterium]|nr:AmmeMemoRadiSam system protein B [Candidatus Hydrogenedentota bacterium]
MPPLPPLRYVDAVPVQHEGEAYVCISDPTGCVEAQLLLSGPAFFVAACLDGTQDIAGIQRAFARQFGGAQVPAKQVQQVVNYLDEQGFLHNARFESLRRALERDFRAAHQRRAYLAGKSYPADAHELRKVLDGFFNGQLPQAPTNGVPPLRCLVVPHIDFGRGAPAYAAGYRRLFEAGKPDTVFIFGVAHAGAPVPFVLTRKAFETPFGTLETDQHALDKLEAVCAWEPYEYEIVHRTEHSIEFQAVLLAYWFGPAVKIVPILCGTFCESPAQRPAEVPVIGRFLDACRAVAAKPGRRVSVIAGADLAHVGRRFGDDFDITEDILSGIETRDREDLAHVAAGAPEAFYASVMKDENARRVCGLGCIYAALKTVEGSAATGQFLHYGYAPDPSG